LIFPCQKIVDTIGVFIAAEYESKLSAEVKTFVRGNNILPATNRKERLATMEELVHKLLIHETHRAKAGPSRIGLTILDQISYAVFGSLSSLDRAAAIDALHRSRAPGLSAQAVLVQ